MDDWLTFCLFVFKYWLFCFRFVLCLRGFVYLLVSCWLLLIVSYFTLVYLSLLWLDFWLCDFVCEYWWFGRCRITCLLICFDFEFVAGYWIYMGLLILCMLLCLICLMVLRCFDGLVVDYDNALWICVVVWFYWFLFGWICLCWIVLVYCFVGCCIVWVVIFCLCLLMGCFVFVWCLVLIAGWFVWCFVLLLLWFARGLVACVFVLFCCSLCVSVFRLCFCYYVLGF